MKGKLVLAFGFMLFFGIVFTACGQGTANGRGEPDTHGQGTANGGGEPDTQKLLGTWVNEADGSTMVFNSDGTGSAPEQHSYGVGKITFHKYGIAGGKMAWVGEMGREREPVTSVYDFQISSDGKILIISRGSANVSLANGSLLRKKE